MKVSGFMRLLDRCADIGFHPVHRNHILAGDVTAALRGDLVFEHQRGNAKTLGGLERMHQCLGVAVAVVPVHHDGKVTGRNYVADAALSISPRVARPTSGRPKRAPMSGNLLNMP